MHERQSSERPRKGELATISHKFSFVHVLCPDEGKNDIAEIKVDLYQVYNVAHRKCIMTKTCVMLGIAELTSKKKTGRGRKSLLLSEKDNFRLCVLLSKLHT